MWWTLLLADQDQDLLIQHTCLDDLVIYKLFSLMLPGSFLHCPTHSFLLIFMETSAGRNHFYDINTRFVSKVSYLHLNEIQYTGKPRTQNQRPKSCDLSYIHHKPQNFQLQSQEPTCHHILKYGFEIWQCGTVVPWQELTLI